MKKILVLSNGGALSFNTLQFAMNIAITGKATLHALFLAALNQPGDTYKADFADTKNIDADEFKNLCSKSNISADVHDIHDNFLDNVIDQSIFADLIICDEKMDEKKFSLNSLMANAHCPVTSIPKNALPFTEIILAFDESSSSMYSIKQFTYLFSQWLHLPAYLVSILPENVIDLEYRQPLNEWLQFYFTNISIEILKGKEDELLTDFINKHQNAIVVMGAFGRNALSRLFKDSLANVILEKTKSALFTTHD